MNGTLELKLNYRPDYNVCLNVLQAAVIEGRWNVVRVSLLRDVDQCVVLGEPITQKSSSNQIEVCVQVDNIDCNVESTFVTNVKKCFFNEL